MSTRELGPAKDQDLQVGGLHQDLWFHLNRAKLEPIPDHFAAAAVDLRFEALREAFADQSTRVIFLRDLSTEDETYLQGKGISSETLFRNLKTLRGRFHDPRAFQLTAITSRAIFALCPFTSRRLRSTHSLLANINVIFYRFESKLVFYVVTAGIGSGFQKCAIYFPDFELIVTAGDAWSFDPADLVELKARVVSNAQLCYEYLADPESANRRLGVCLGFYHFAHHLWNELSGIERLYQGRLLSKVDRFLVTREPLGKLDEIFTEISPSQVERSASTHDLFLKILQERYFAIKVGDDFIAKDLSRRVHRVAKERCLPETIQRISELTNKHAPILWIGIRVGNRSWADQVAGITNLVSSLQAKLPRLGVVLDGFSLPGDRSMGAGDAKEFDEAISQENEVAESILSQLRSRQEVPGLVNIIGSSIFDAIVWANTIDVYLSPYGSLQHKVGWLANKPGLIHTNRTLLNNTPQYVWRAVEGGVQPWYVNSAIVSDLQVQNKERFAYNGISDARESGAGIEANNGRVRSNPEFNDYCVDWRPVLESLLQLFGSTSRKHRFSKSVLLNGIRRHIRSILSDLATQLDPTSEV